MVTSPTEGDATLAQAPAFNANETGQNQGTTTVARTILRLDQSTDATTTGDPMRATDAVASLVSVASVSDDTRDKSPEERRGSMNWAQRLKRVFGIDVAICDQCGGAIKVIACIKDPQVIKKILDHLDKKTASDQRKRRPQSWAPPQGSLFN